MLSDRASVPDEVDGEGRIEIELAAGVQSTGSVGSTRGGGG